ncbi:hypothetical protein HY622_03750 [Candidatus Uhrbacteria bacterium]|nr:hypothetical protein [Candidatus Uhrbacteria bacterium]
MKLNKSKKRLAVGFGCAILVFALNGIVADPLFADTELINPLGNIKTIPALVNRILGGLFGIVGVVALLVFLYGGFTWMTSEGAEKKIKKGWDTMVWGALGLIIIFASFILVRFLLGILLTETTAQGGGSNTTQGGGVGGGMPNQPQP